MDQEHVLEIPVQLLLTHSAVVYTLLNIVICLKAFEYQTETDLLNGPGT